MNLTKTILNRNYFDLNFSVLKVFFFVTLFTAFSFTKAIPVYAADFQIICQTTECSGLSGPIIYETNMLPGDSTTKTLEILNNKDEALTVQMQTFTDSTSEPYFLELLEMKFLLNNSVNYTGNAVNFLDKTYDLGTLGINQTMQLGYEIYFPTSAGNEFQNNMIVFDLMFTFIGSETGETQVLSTDTASTTQGSVIGDSDEKKSGLGEILGLSDTSSEILRISGIFLGMMMLMFGTRMLIRSRQTGE